MTDPSTDPLAQKTPRLISCVLLAPLRAPTPFRSAGSQLSILDFGR